MSFRLIRKLITYDSCGIIVTKAKPITNVPGPSKKASDAGERLFSDATRSVTHP